MGLAHPHVVRGGTLGGASRSGGPHPAPTAMRPYGHAAMEPFSHSAIQPYGHTAVQPSGEAGTNSSSRPTAPLPRGAMQAAEIARKEHCGGHWRCAGAHDGEESGNQHSKAEGSGHVRSAMIASGSGAKASKTGRSRAPAGRTGIDFSPCVGNPAAACAPVRAPTTRPSRGMHAWRHRGARSAPLCPALLALEHAEDAVVRGLALARAALRDRERGREGERERDPCPIGQQPCHMTSTVTWQGAWSMTTAILRWHGRRNEGAHESPQSHATRQ
jgi:hypothetical protein